ncbi:class I SAM-dependent methyltransferase [Calothrix rhizosoleniae]|uniref:class I SAM-dependent methyltransferase n=1 Tax=Calothrix rhizosoleniae TaxID=888997 RepID=UPI000B4A248B|nr:methyltransferase domain-containing protein [Calothrix rhizosoleniae]
MSNSLYVQYGCGLCAPDNWYNFDASPNLWLERFPVFGRLYAGRKNLGGKRIRQRFPSNIQYGDIVRGLPIEANSCCGVYASHVLEHLSLEDFRVALVNTYKILKPNGIFRLVVPDLEVIARHYISSHSSNAAIEFFNATGLGIRNRPKGLSAVTQAILGNGGHLWMWDYKSLKYKLEVQGFVEIRRAEFNDSADSNFSIVEDSGRFVNSVAVECKKPCHQS